VKKQASAIETPLFRTLVSQIPAFVAALPPPADEICALIRPKLPNMLVILCGFAANEPKPNTRREDREFLRSAGFPCPPPPD
jgi:hypothetical protein